VRKNIREIVIMKQSLVLILAGIACIMLIAAGCTNNAGTVPAAPAVTTAAPESPLPTTTATALPASQAPSWTGTWNTSYSVQEYGHVTELITMTQDGSSVTGVYHFSNGTISATVLGDKLAGTWHDSDSNGTYSGFFEFTRAADDTFSGRWVATAEGADALKNTTQTWNGFRVPVTTAVTTAAVQTASGKTPWSGNWNTTWLEKDGNRTVSPMTMTQAGNNVSATFRYAYPGEGSYTGILTATVKGNTITGTYAETDNDTGYFEFALSQDQKAFTGTWAHASAGEGALANSTLFWNGFRV
jgi:hypothetical protein